MTDTVTAPQAEEAEGTTPEAATPEKQPLTLREQIVKAMAKDMPAKHEGFVEWMKANADIDIDLNTVLATQSLYGKWRQTDEFKLIPSTATTKAEPEPKTPEEAKAALEKAQKSQERAKATQERAAERAAKIQALLAEMNAGDAGEESDEAVEAESDEELAEAF